MHCTSANEGGPINRTHVSQNLSGPFSPDIILYFGVRYIYSLKKKRKEKDEDHTKKCKSSH